MATRQHIDGADKFMLDDCKCVAVRTLHTGQQCDAHHKTQDSACMVGKWEFARGTFIQWKRNVNVHTYKLLAACRYGDEHTIKNNSTTCIETIHKYHPYKTLLRTNVKSKMRNTQPTSFSEAIIEKEQGNALNQAYKCKYSRVYHWLR